MGTAEEREAFEHRVRALCAQAARPRASSLGCASDYRRTIRCSSF